MKFTISQTNKFLIKKIFYFFLVLIFFRDLDAVECQINGRTYKQLLILADKIKANLIYNSLNGSLSVQAKARFILNDYFPSFLYHEFCVSKKELDSNKLYDPQIFLEQNEYYNEELGSLLKEFEDTLEQLKKELKSYELSLAIILRELYIKFYSDTGRLLPLELVSNQNWIKLPSNL